MIHIKGDALKVFEDYPESILFHQVNCKGIMGGGIAKQIKEAYPNHFSDYIKFTNQYRTTPLLGEYVHTDIDAKNPETSKMIIGLYGQEDIGIHERQTNYAALARSLYNCFVEWGSFEFMNQPVFIIPKYIGCGLGGGILPIVEQILLDVESVFDVEFTCVEFDQK